LPGRRIAGLSLGSCGTFFDAVDCLLDPPHMTEDLIDRLSELINHLLCSAFVGHGVLSWQLTASVRIISIM
jgi:hypothetical protein